MDSNSWLWAVVSLNLLNWLYEFCEKLMTERFKEYEKISQSFSKVYQNALKKTIFYLCEFGVDIQLKRLIMCFGQSFLKCLNSGLIRS